MSAIDKILEILESDNIEEFECIVEFVEEAIVENNSGDDRKIKALELFFNEYTEDSDDNPFNNAGFDELIECYYRI